MRRQRFKGFHLEVVMGHFSAQTGVPLLSVVYMRPAKISSVRASRITSSQDGLGGLGGELAANGSAEQHVAHAGSA